MTVHRDPITVTCTVCKGVKEVYCHSCSGKGTEYNDYSGEMDECYTCKGQKTVKCLTCGGVGSLKEIQGRHFKAACNDNRIWCLYHRNAKHDDMEMYGDGLPGSAKEAFLVVRGMDMVIEDQEYQKRKNTHDY